MCVTTGYAHLPLLRCVICSLVLVALSSVPFLLQAEGYLLTPDCAYVFDKHDKIDVPLERDFIGFVRQLLKATTSAAEARQLEADVDAKQKLQLAVTAVVQAVKTAPSELKTEYELLWTLLCDQKPSITVPKNLQLTALQEKLLQPPSVIDKACVGDIPLLRKARMEMSTDDPDARKTLHFLDLREVGQCIEKSIFRIMAQNIRADMTVATTTAQIKDARSAYERYRVGMLGLISTLTKDGDSESLNTAWRMYLDLAVPAILKSDKAAVRYPFWNDDAPKKLIEDHVAQLSEHARQAAIAFMSSHPSFRKIQWDETTKFDNFYVLLFDMAHTFHPLLRMTNTLKTLLKIPADHIIYISPTVLVNGRQVAFQKEHVRAFLRGESEKLAEFSGVHLSIPAGAKILTFMNVHGSACDAPEKIHTRGYGEHEFHVYPKKYAKGGSMSLDPDMSADYSHEEFLDDLKRFNQRISSCLWIHMSCEAASVFQTTLPKLLGKVQVVAPPKEVGEKPDEVANFDKILFVASANDLSPTVVIADAAKASADLLEESWKSSIWFNVLGALVDKAVAGEKLRSALEKLIEVHKRPENVNPSYHPSLSRELAPAKWHREKVLLKQGQETRVVLAGDSGAPDPVFNWKPSFYGNPALLDFPICSLMPKIWCPSAQ